MVLFGQGPGTFSAPFSITKPYGLPGGATQEISTFTPYDSGAGYLHPLIIMAGGANEITSGHTHDITTNTIAYSAKNSGTSLRTKNHGLDSVAHPYVTYYIIWAYKDAAADGSGNWDMRYFKNAWAYATGPLAGKVDPNKIYLSVLSLSGGGGADLLRDSVIWATRFAAMAINDAVVGNIYVDNQTDITNNINTSGLHVRFWWGENDTQSNSPTFRDKMKFYYGGTSGNTTRPYLMLINGGTHGSGWQKASDTIPVSFSNNATFTPSGSDDPTTLEWFTFFRSSTAITNQAPVSNAGSPQTITLPTSSVTLNGSASYDPDGRPLSAYLWTRTSGPNTPTIVSSTTASTSVTGLIQGSYVFNLRVTDDSAATANSTVAITVNAMAADTGHYVKPYDYFDFRYSGVDRFHPKFFFDNNTPTEGTPRKMQNYYGFNQMYGSILHKFTGYSQCSGWFDMVGDSSLRDTTHKVKIYSIKYYSRGPAGYKMYAFNGDKFWRPAYHNRSAAIDDPGGYAMVPFDSAITISTPGWVNGNITVPDSMRYIFIVIMGDTTSQNLAKFGEMIINGTRLYDSTTINYRKEFTAAFDSKLTDSTTFGKQEGDDQTQGRGPKTSAYYLRHRIFSPASIGDTAVAQPIPPKYAFPYLFSGFNLTRIAAMKAAGQEIYMTNQAGSAYNAANSMDFLYTDTLNGRTSNPNNWKRAADYNTQLVKVMGRVTGGTNKFSTTIANGQDLEKFHAVGNEDDGHSQNYRDVFAKLSAIYDGNESSIIIDGVATGIKNADPSMQMVMSASQHWDTMYLKTLYFYSQMLRADGKLPFDVIDMHRYLATVDSTGGIVYDSEDKYGSTSSTPERAYDSHTGLTKLTDTLFRRIYKYFKKPFWWSETGRSAWGHPSAIGAIVDESATPSVGSKDSSMVAAELDYREAHITMATQIQRRYHYEDANPLGATYGAARFAGMGYKYRYNDTFPGDFEFHAMLTGGYVQASTLRDRSFAHQSWVYPENNVGYIQQFTRKPSTDSVAEYPWFGTLKDSSATRVVNLATGYRVTVNVSEMPLGIFYKESNPSQVDVVYPSFTTEAPTVVHLTATTGSPGRYQLLPVWRKP